jgi:hypothetical protein
MCACTMKVPTVPHMLAPLKLTSYTSQWCSGMHSAKQERQFTKIVGCMIAFALRLHACAHDGAHCPVKPRSIVSSALCGMVGPGRWVHYDAVNLTLIVASQ